MTATEANDMLKAIENDDIFPLVYVAITYGLRKGWDLEAVKAWLRHADIETTSNIYLHVSKDRKHLLAADMHGTFIAPIVENNNDTETGEKKDA